MFFSTKFHPIGTFEKYLAKYSNFVYLVYRNVALTKDGKGAPFWLVTEFGKLIPNILCTREASVTAVSKQPQI